MVVKRKYIFIATRFDSILSEFVLRVSNQKYNKFPYNDWRSLNQALDWARDQDKDVVVLIEPDFRTDIIIGDYTYRDYYDTNSIGKFLYDFLDENWDNYRFDEVYEERKETDILSGVRCDPITGNTIYDTINASVSANLDCYYDKSEIECKIEDLNTSIATKTDVWITEDLKRNISAIKIRVDNNDAQLMDTDMRSAHNEADIERLYRETDRLYEVAEDYNSLKPYLDKIIEKYLKDTEIKNEKEIKINMKGFNFDFGSCANNSSIRMSMYGIAVQNASGSWVSYDPKEGKIVDVDIMNFEGVGQYMYKMPTAIDALKTGDVVIHNRKAMFITNIDENGKITAVDPHAGEEKTILPAVSPFGFNFVTKIVSMFDAFNTVNPAPSAPFGNMLPFIMMGEDKDIDPMMMMFMMNGGQGFDMSNPMMMYMLMKDKNSSFDSILPFLIVGNMNK